MMWAIVRTPSAYSLKARSTCKINTSVYGYRQLVMLPTLAAQSARPAMGPLYAILPYSSIALTLTAPWVADRCTANVPMTKPPQKMPC